MTTKEKASDLFLKFRQVPPCSTYTGIDDGEAKQCALIAVVEIINSIVITDLTTAENQFKYWDDVKEEIEKL
jgi:hypothetical protein